MPEEIEVPTEQLHETLHEAAHGHAPQAWVARAALERSVCSLLPQRWRRCSLGITLTVSDARADEGDRSLGALSGQRHQELARVENEIDILVGGVRQRRALD